MKHQHLKFALGVRLSPRAHFETSLVMVIYYGTRYDVISSRWSSHFRVNCMFFQLISEIKVKLVDNMIQSNYLCVILHVNPRTHKQIHTPIVLQGGWMEPISVVFDILQYFETILPLVENL